MNPSFPCLSFVRLTAIAIFGLVALPQAKAHSQSPAPILSIMQIDSSRFPAVSVQIIARDSSGHSLSNLTKESFLVSENGTGVEHTLAKKTVGIQAAFVIDSGMGISSPGATGQSRWSEMQTAMETLLASPWMMSGSDSLSLIIQDSSSTKPLASGSTDSAPLLSAIRQYAPEKTASYSDGLEGINAALDYFSSNPNTAAKFKTIVFFSAGLQSGGEDDVEKTIGKARAAGVPIYTVLFRPSEETPYVKSMRSLSDRTGGGYTFYDSSGNETMKSLAALLESFRSHYVLSYRSPSGESGTRVVDVNLNLAGSATPAAEKYEIDIQPPAVQIVSPQEGGTLALPTQIPPTPASTETATPEAISVSLYRVKAQVTWPDAHARNIAKLEVLFNGTAVSEIANPKPDDAGAIEISIPKDSLPKELPNDIQILLRLTDEFGLVGESKPIMATRSADGSADSSGCANIPTALQKILCPNQPGDALSINTVLPWISILLAFASVGFVLFFRKPIAGAATQVSHAAAEIAEGVGQTMRFRGKLAAPKAYLADIDNSTGNSKPYIELYGTTTIGRSRKHANITVQAADPNTPVSRLHCTILEEDGEFFVRDEQSANGTYVNATRLVPLERKPLKASDILELGKAENHGVRLRFQKTKPENPNAQSSPESQPIEMTNRIQR